MARGRAGNSLLRPVGRCPGNRTLRQRSGFALVPTRWLTLLGCFLATLVAAVGCSREADLTFREDDRAADPASQLATKHRRERPRAIFLILIDALRADHLGAYGSGRNLTPNLDAIARHSYVFENAWATSSWTRSSVASLFTSRYPASLGVLGARDVLQPDSPTVAELLKAHAGYRCIGISANRNAGRNFGAIRNESSKLIRDRTKSTSDEGAHEPFDLSLATQAKRRTSSAVGAPEVEAHLKGVMKRYAQAFSSGVVPGRTIRLDELDRDTLEALRGLGYVEK